MTTWPKWLSDLRRLLPIRSQFAFSGNVRDVFLTPLDGQSVPLPLLDALWQALRAAGYEFVVVHDRVDGLTALPRSPETMARVAQLLGLTPRDGRLEVSLNRLPGLIRRITETGDVRAAVVLDYASRIPVAADRLSEAEHEFYSACEKLSHTARPVARRDQGGALVPLYNPLIWILNRDNDLPAWLTAGNDLVHAQVISRPDYATRMAAAGLLGGPFAGYGAATEEERESFARTFAANTDALPLQAMVAITQLARDQGIGWRDIANAVRLYKVGLPDNPWKGEHLRERIRGAEDAIRQRIKGQDQAIGKTVDILKRSVMGLTGAQSASTDSGRPRGVLFFAGPTGVGKTELAKALTQLLFNDDRAYIRFDMSEFAAEHADARLLGAPPGYVGFDAGGELTNAIRERPFSIVLFDEIEKAHPRILDKFLQVLEDGRLTDGRGETVYFSEAILIFTSNLGIYVDDGVGGRVQQVTPDEPYDQVDAKIRRAIQDYFKFQLNRPEILNRFGDNIVVFNFIARPVGELIFDGMLRNILRRVRAEHGLALTVSDTARATLMELCLADLSNGGRGIGNRLETVFINPLARALFDSPCSDSATVTAVTSADGLHAVSLA